MLLKAIVGFIGAVLILALFLGLLVLVATPASAQQTGIVKLVWDSAIGAATYVVERKTASCTGSGTFAVIAPNVPTNSYTDTTPLVGTRYAYRVASKNAQGTQSAGYSNCIEQVVQAPPPAADTQPPPIPQNFTVGAAVAGTETATFPLTWDVVLDPPGNQPVPIYLYDGGFNDGSGAISGSSTTTSAAAMISYHASGQAQEGWICLRGRDAAQNLGEASCRALSIPAKPIAPPTLPPAPIESARCAKRYQGTPPDTTTGWSMELFNGTTSLSPKGTTTLRDVMLEEGPYSITAKWTKTGATTQTSKATTGVCGALGGRR